MGEEEEDGGEGSDRGKAVLANSANNVAAQSSQSAGNVGNAAQQQGGQNQQNGQQQNALGNTTGTSVDPAVERAFAVAEFAEYAIPLFMPPKVLCS